MTKSEILELIVNEIEKYGNIINHLEISPNDEYYQGKKDAYKDVINLVKTVKVSVTNE